MTSTFHAALRDVMRPRQTQVSNLLPCLIFILSIRVPEGRGNCETYFRDFNYLPPQIPTLFYSFDFCGRSQAWRDHRLRFRDPFAFRPIWNSSDRSGARSRPQHPHIPDRFSFFVALFRHFGLISR